MVSGDTGLSQFRSGSGSCRSIQRSNRIFHNRIFYAIWGFIQEKKHIYAAYVIKSPYILCQSVNMQPNVLCNIINNYINNRQTSSIKTYCLTFSDDCQWLFRCNLVTLIIFVESILGSPAFYTVLMHELWPINITFSIKRCIQMSTITLMRNVIITGWVETFLPEMQIKGLTISNNKKYIKKKKSDTS